MREVQATVVRKTPDGCIVRVRRSYEHESLGWNSQAEKDAVEPGLRVGDKIVVARIVNDPYVRFVRLV